LALPGSVVLDLADRLEVVNRRWLAARNRDEVNRGELLRLRDRVGTMAGGGAPLILIAAADDAVRQRLVADVEHRFGAADYAVVGAVSGGAALDFGRRLCEGACS
jgi:hypothetical protein